MARQPKAGATKRTYRLDDEMVARLARIAVAEGRTVTAQMERFLWEKIREYEKAAPSEKSPGNRTTMQRAA